MRGGMYSSSQVFIGSQKRYQKAWETQWVGPMLYQPQRAPTKDGAGILYFRTEFETRILRKHNDRTASEAAG